MATIKASIKRPKLTTYFALTFAISWGAVLVVIGGPGGIRGTTAQSDPLFPLVQPSWQPLRKRVHRGSCPGAPIARSVLEGSREFEAITRSTAGGPNAHE